MLLTHWGWDKMAAIFQMTSSYTFSWMKIYEFWLTHWGRATHICVSKLTIIGSDDGLSPGRRQAITWTNDGILLIGSLGTNVNEILSKFHRFSFKKMHLKTSSAKWRPFCLSLNVLKFHWSLFASVQLTIILHKAMMALFTDAYMRHSASMS